MLQNTQIIVWMFLAGYFLQSFHREIFGIRLKIDPRTLVPLVELTKVKTPALQTEVFTLVIPAGFEPAISWMRTRCPGPLDDGTVFNI